MVWCYDRLLSHPFQFIIRHHIISALQKAWCNVMSFCFRGCPTCHEAAIAGGSPGGVMDWGFPSNLHESRLLRLLLLFLMLLMAGMWLFWFTHYKYGVKVLCYCSVTHHTAAVCDFLMIMFCFEYGNGSLGFLTNSSAIGCCDLLITSVHKPVGEIASYSWIWTYLILNITWTKKPQQCKSRLHEFARKPSLFCKVTPLGRRRACVIPL